MGKGQKKTHTKQQSNGYHPGPNLGEIRRSKESENQQALIISLLGERGGEQKYEKALEELGIGGLGEEMRTLVRRALASRLMPASLARQLGVKNLRGILLSGPPGTGKTLIARQLAKLLNARAPKFVSGPELLSMWVGKSEENIRQLFAEAEAEHKEKGDKASLHLIVFDEVDALTRRRGALQDSSGVIDSCVNQLLSKIDGLSDNDNILVIGTTNRKDLIDDALLRPGRLELHLEVGLPDEQGRQQIFHVHTRGYQEHNLLCKTVDLKQLARLTPNYTGAEIEAVVRSALSYALQRQVSQGDEYLSLKMLDFMRGIKEIKARYGTKSLDWNTYLEFGFVEFNPRVKSMHDKMLDYLRLSHEGADCPQIMRFLFTGPSGSGKTAFMAKVTSTCNHAFRRVVTSTDLLGLNEHESCDFLIRSFQDAHQCRHSILLLDNIESLIQYSEVGQKYSNDRLQTMHSLLKLAPKPKRRLCVLVTSSLSPSILKDLGLVDVFTERFDLPLVREVSEVRTLIDQSPNLTPAAAAVLEDLVKTSTAKDSRDTTLSQGIPIRALLHAGTLAKEKTDSN